MFCPNCGTQNEGVNNFCQNCGANLEVTNNPNDNVIQENVVSQQNVNNNYQQMPTFKTGHSIFLIVFSLLCCGGIIGVIFAVMSLVEGNKVNDFAAMGDYENAMKHKKESDKWIKATYITMAVVAALMLIYFVFVIFSSIVLSV